MKRILIAVFAAMLAVLAPAAAMAGAVDYRVGGEAFEGYYAAAKGTSKGLVLVIHDWDGLNDYEIRRADMLSALGYDAFAPDLYGKGNRPASIDGRKAETAKLYKDRARMQSLILGGLDAGRRAAGGNSPAVVMGYCFGGAAVLELARSGKGENIRGYATFHGGLKTPKGQRWPQGGTAPILIAHGGADSGIPMTDVATLAGELEAAKTPYEIQVYSGAPHGFTVFDSNRYQKEADTQSWDAFTDFLGDTLRGG